MADNNSILERNKYFYLYMKSKVDFESMDLESVYRNLGLIEKIGKFAWRNHPGCFYDAEIENILQNYSARLENYFSVAGIEQEIENLFPKDKNYSTLHIATDIANIGGHTRAINQIIKRSKEQNQCFVLTNGELLNVPGWFKKGTEEFAQTFSLSNYNSYFEKAFALRVLSKRFKRIILYHHPFDVIPALAFSHNCNTPIAVENHAHSWFWFGISITDLIICHSQYRIAFTKNYRGHDNCFHLPFTQFDNVNNLADASCKKQAREILNIGLDKTVILTVATREKFIPNSEYNYFEVVENILDKYPNVIIIVAGLSNQDVLVQDVKKSDRLLFHEQITDLKNYYLASDICLESMPQPSLGVQIQAPVIGLCSPFPAYGKFKDFKNHFFENSNLYKEHFGKEMSKEDFYEKLDLFIKNPSLCLSTAQEVRACYLENKSDQKIYDKLMEIYGIIDSLTHTTKKLSRTNFYNDEENIEIAVKSELQDLPKVIRYWINEFSKSIETKLYFDLGDGFNESNSFVKHLDINTGSENTEVEIKFDLKNIEKGIINLRFDPIENSTCIVEIKEVELICGGEKKYLSVADSNAALNYNNKLVFTSDDPNVLFIIPQDAANIESVIFRLQYLSEEKYLRLIGEIIAENSSQQDEAKKEYISKLYYDNGKGYSEENSVVSILPDLLTNNLIELDFDLKDAGAINALRLDPIENESAVVEIESCTAYYQNNSFPLSIVKANADFHSKGCFVFSTTDPNLHLSLPKGAQKIDFLNVKYRLLVRNNKQ
jgi:hypothetical protein